MTTKGPYDQDTWSPWLTKVTYKAPKAMSLQAFKMALLKKRLAEAKSISARAAESKESRAEAAADVEAIRAELRAAKEREERMKHVKAHAEAAEEATEAQEAADKARAKVARLREEFEEEEREIVAKSKREQEARARALTERERKRSEQRAKLEHELERAESERHKQVLKLKSTLKEHADAKRKVAEDAAPEEGELDDRGGAPNATGNPNPFEDGTSKNPLSHPNTPRFRDGIGRDGPSPTPRVGMGNTPGSGNWGAQGSDMYNRAGPPQQQPPGCRGEIRYGDWMCPKGCGNVFASKMRCFRCGAPKPASAAHHQGSNNQNQHNHNQGGGGWGDRPRMNMGGGRGNW
jgi:hypothetical protein|tara:strand:- start:7731 stop:8774 length:1044 start_codon:yes stop_codon:yes gene_type:complete